MIKSVCILTLEPHSLICLHSHPIFPSVYKSMTTQRSVLFFYTLNIQFICQLFPFLICKFIISFLKITFHVQFLQILAILYIYVQYILEYIYPCCTIYPRVYLKPNSCTSPTSAPVLPLALPLVTSGLFSLSVSRLLFCYIH